MYSDKTYGGPLSRLRHAIQPIKTGQAGHSAQRFIEE
jgi:hypothetical protein